VTIWVRIDLSSPQTPSVRTKLLKAELEDRTVIGPPSMYLMQVN